MEFIIVILLFVVIGIIVIAVRSNKKKVNLTKQNNIHNSSNNSSPLFSLLDLIIMTAHMIAVHMTVEGLLEEIVEVVAVIDKNTPYIGVFLFKQTFD